MTAMTDTQLKSLIAQHLKRFQEGTLAANATALLNTLGYRSDKTLTCSPNTAQGFLDTFPSTTPFNRDKTLLSHWQSVDLIFQITDDEVKTSGQTAFVFDSRGTFDDARMESYLFFAIRLAEDDYTRTQLADITREVNRRFAMPAMMLFQHGQTLTLSVVNRRLHKRDESRDVLEKVTLIKDIRFTEPHRAHVEILFDLSFDQLRETYGFSNFVELHEAWRKTLDSSALNKRFYKELANWYFWALQRVTFPQQKGVDEAVNRATNVIRLITRLVFTWFVKEKGLVPDDLFNERRLHEVLVDLSPGASTYYKAILQNLFFATLNTEMNTPEKPENRKFRGKASQPHSRDQHYMVHNVYRYGDTFYDPDAALRLFSSIPFLNGGLFECLDKEETIDGKPVTIRIDGFSDRDDNPLSVPNDLFFSNERTVDLNEAYGTRNKSYKVRGLLDILHSYKFTINENTPVEEEIALDPELLGQVFENLLASYNPETGGTARKQTGSFYTPREIVNYMVDESLIAHLETTLSVTGAERVNERLRHLLAYNEEPHQFSEPEVDILIDAIDTLNILDPACGSGAFPMGILHKLVFILSKLDTGNEKWKEKQIAKLDDVVMRDEMERVFRDNYDDYGRKLYLIQNAIYGVDIQPIAVQIAKLRFFISLVVDQRVDDTKGNRGIRALPNLETKFVAANALLGIEKPIKLPLRNPVIDQKEQELAEIRRQHFTARTQRTKAKYRDLDAKLRAEISDLLKKDGFPGEATQKLAYWDPYDQNQSADFFDPEWMFGIRDGFDVVIANPPYVRQEEIKELKPALQTQYACYTGVADLYVYFYERGFQLLKSGGLLTYISSNKYFRSGYGEKLRHLLSTQSTVHQLIDFGDAPVFTAIAYPSIIMVRKALPDTHQVRVLTWEPGPPIEEFAAVFHASSFLIAQKELTADGWRLESPAVLRLLEKLRCAGKPLGEYVNGRFYRGIVTGLNEAFVVDRATRDRLIAEHLSSGEVLKPFLRGRDVKRWRVGFADQYLIKIESSENKRHPWSGRSEKEAEKIFAQTYPAIHARFEAFRAGLIKRDDQGKYFWELRSCVYWNEFEKPGIIYPELAFDPQYAWSERGWISDCTLYVIPDEGKCLTAVMNSSAVRFFFHQVSPKVRGGYMRFKALYMGQIPIPNALTENRVVLEGLVDHILAIKHDATEADVSALEREIDQLVYKLYGLTAEEIAIVEETLQR